MFYIFNVLYFVHGNNCDARVLSKSDILLYNPKFPKLANCGIKNLPKLANGLNMFYLLGESDLELVFTV